MKEKKNAKLENSLNSNYFKIYQFYCIDVRQESPMGCHNFAREHLFNLINLFRTGNTPDCG